MRPARLLLLETLVLAVWGATIGDRTAYAAEAPSIPIVWVRVGPTLQAAGKRAQDELQNLGLVSKLNSAPADVLSTPAGNAAQPAADATITFAAAQGRIWAVVWVRRASTGLAAERRISVAHPLRAPDAEFLALWAAEQLDALLLRLPTGHGPADITEQSLTPSLAALDRGFGMRMSVAALGLAANARQVGPELGFNWMARPWLVLDVSGEMAGTTSDNQTAAGDLAYRLASLRVAALLAWPASTRVRVEAGPGAGMLGARVTGTPGAAFEARVRQTVVGLASVGLRAAINLGAHLELMPALELGLAWPGLHIEAAGIPVVRAHGPVWSARLGLQWRI